MKWKIIQEEYTPCDIDIIRKELDGNNVSHHRYTPSKKFLRNSYGLLNELLFNDKLPKDIAFKIEHDLKDSSAGHTVANDDISEGEFNIEYMSLNGTVMLPIHTWMEVILHEMIHVYDFTCFPEHYMNARRNGTVYDEHGDWFMKQASKFKEYGFNVEKTLTSKWDTSVDDEDIKQIQYNSIYFKIAHNPLGWDDVLKVDKADRNHVLSILKDKKYTSVIEIRTENLNSVRLDDINVDLEKPLMTYHADDDFNDKYGPFEEVETIDLTNMAFNENNSVKSSRSTMVITKLPDGRWQYRT